MKIFISIAILFFSTGAFAFSADVLTIMLNSPIVKKELQGFSITKVITSEKTSGTTWTYTAVFQTVREGEDPATALPCGTVVELTTIGGVVGTEVLDPVVKTNCMML